MRVQPVSIELALRELRELSHLAGTFVVVQTGVFKSSIRGVRYEGFLRYELGYLMTQRQQLTLVTKQRCRVCPVRANSVKSAFE